MLVQRPNIPMAWWPQNDKKTLIWSWSFLTSHKPCQSNLHPCSCANNSSRLSCIFHNGTRTHAPGTDVNGLVYPELSLMTLSNMASGLMALKTRPKCPSWTPNIFKKKSGTFLKGLIDLEQYSWMGWKHGIRIVIKPNFGSENKG